MITPRRFSPTLPLPRRRFLRGLGLAVALPAFESLRKTATATAAAAPAGVPRLATTPTGAPLRVAFVYFPNGAIQPNWWPTGSGARFELARTMKPMERLKGSLQVLGGLDHVHAKPGPDGSGDHARASGTFLTGVRVRKTAGTDLKAAISIDQVIANHVGHLTRFPSLELTCDAVRKSGNCDSGYSCAYQYNLSWRGPSTPVAPEPNPRLLFERLFGAGPHGQRQESVRRRQQRQRSILDFVADDARALQRQLDGNDTRKLDEYLTSLRDVEGRIERAERIGLPHDPAVETPEGVPSSYPEYIQVMFDLLALAFQSDSTRVATFLLANEGNNRGFPEIGIPEGHHSLSHHQNKKELIEKVAEIDLFYARQFARFLEKMAQTKDVDGRSLLHNSMILYGCGNADGNRHSHTNLPALLAGHGGGALTPGRYVQHPDVPMSNLFLSLADRLGVTGLERFGDSTGRLQDV